MSEPATATRPVDAALDMSLAEPEATEIPSLGDGSGDTVVAVLVPALNQGQPLRPPEPAANPPVAAPKPVEVPSAPRAARWVHGGVRLIYPSVDKLLWAMNRPFEWLPPTARRLTGWIAVITIVTSVLALLLLPRCFPPEDLHARVMRHRTPPPAAEPTPSDAHHH